MSFSSEENFKGKLFVQLITLLQAVMALHMITDAPTTAVSIVEDLNSGLLIQRVLRRGKAKDR